VETTNKYYLRIKNTVAIEKAQMMWAGRKKCAEYVDNKPKPHEGLPSGAPDKKTSIEAQKRTPGYA
jgi:hypothetical protein